MIEGRGRLRRWFVATKEQWRLARPFAKPPLDMKPMEWLPRYREARRGLLVKTIGALTVLALVLGSAAFIDAWVHARARHRQLVVLAHEVRRLQRFVENVRGLSFRRPVPVKLVSEAEFQVDTGSVDYLRDLLVALYPAFGPLRLSTGGGDPTEVASLVADRELGVYDDRTGAIEVRASSITPFTRRILVHELTHALDDQHYSFRRLDRTYKGHQQSLAALYEGDARYVEEQYLASLSVPERVFAGGVTLSSTSHVPGVPDDVLELVTFPYTKGSVFIASLVRDGGESAVDDAFQNPPLVDHEILHPEFFQAERTAERRFVVFPPSPKPVGPAFGLQGQSYFLGEEITRLYLGEVLGGPRARRAASYWSGDLSTVWNNGRTDCIHVVYTRPTSKVGREALSGALADWVKGTSGARLDPSRFGFVACG